MSEGAQKGYSRISRALATAGALLILAFVGPEVGWMSQPATVIWVCGPLAAMVLVWFGAGRSTIVQVIGWLMLALGLAPFLGG